MQTLSVEESHNPKKRTPNFWGMIGVITILVLAYPLFVGLRYSLHGSEQQRNERYAFDHVSYLAERLTNPHPKRYATYVTDANGKSVYSLSALVEFCKDTPATVKEYVPKVRPSIAAALHAADAECKQLAQKGLHDPSSLTKSEINAAANRITATVELVIAPEQEAQRVMRQKQAEESLQKILR